MADDEALSIPEMMLMVQYLMMDRAQVHPPSPPIITNTYSAAIVMAMYCLDAASFCVETKAGMGVPETQAILSRLRGELAEVVGLDNADVPRAFRREEFRSMQPARDILRPWTQGSPGDVDEEDDENEV
jgi:hypothetical protein